MTLLRQIDHLTDRWLFAPETNAAGRAGLFRIVFSLFYLWNQSLLHYTEIDAIMIRQWNPPDLWHWMPKPTPAFFPIAESVLAALLILLLIGWHVRLTTLAVLLLGFALHIYKDSIIIVEHVMMLMTFYIPLFMLFSQWGSTYSLDALLKRRRGEPTPTPTDSDGQYAWHMRALLLIFVLLFFSAGVIKIQQQDWVYNPRWLADFMLDKTITSYLANGSMPGFINPLLAQVPLIYIPMQYGALIFELSFPLMLIGRHFRALHFRIAPLFHSFNNFFLGIGVPHVLPMYAVFIDWQMLYERFYPRRLRFTIPDTVRSAWLIVGAVTLAALVGALWNTTPISRGIFGLGGLLDLHTIWIPVAFGTLIWLGSEFVGALRGLRTRLQSTTDEHSISHPV